MLKNSYLQCPDSWAKNKKNENKSSKSEKSEKVNKDIKKKIKAALQHQFKIMPREKTHILLLWSILEPVLYFSDLHQDMPNGLGVSKRNDRNRRVSTLNLEVNENIEEILKRSVPHD